MLSALPDMINAEMALGTIASRDDAVRWLGYTYLHVRMMKAPQLYGVPMGDEEGNPRDDPRLIQVGKQSLLMVELRDARYMMYTLFSV